MAFERGNRRFCGGSPESFRGCNSQEMHAARVPPQQYMQAARLPLQFRNLNSTQPGISCLTLVFKLFRIGAQQKTC